MSHLAMMIYPKRRVIAATQVGLFLLVLIFSLILASPVNAQQNNSISGSVFEDLNLNKTFDLRESGLVGWTVSLYKDSALLEATTTNVLGEYTFSGLVADNYNVKLEVLNTWAPVSQESVAVDLRSDLNAQVDFANYKVVADKINITGPFGGMSISNQSIEILSPTSVKITWFTNRFATSQVVFGKISKPNNNLNLNDNNFGYPSSSALNFKTAIFHTITLINLNPGINYNYRLVSLPNPTQWRGAVRIFSDEFIFTTPEIPKEDLGFEIENNTGAIKGVELTDAATSTVMAGDIIQDAEESVGEEEVVKIEEETSAPVRAGPEQDCMAYIWILLLLNIVAIAYVALRTKKSGKKKINNAWWILAILVVVPVILGYAECWLLIWLLVMLVAEVVVISSLSKKKDPSADGPIQNS